MIPVRGYMKGAMLTLRSIGFKALLKETLRRIYGIKYYYRGIPIDSNIAFRLIRSALLNGYDVYGSGNEVTIRTSYGEFCVDIDDADLLFVVFEPLEEMYGFVDVKDAIVIDIGAYIKRRPCCSSPRAPAESTRSSRWIGTTATY